MCMYVCALEVLKDGAGTFGDLQRVSRELEELTKLEQSKAKKRKRDAPKACFFGLCLSQKYIIESALITNLS